MVVERHRRDTRSRKKIHHRHRCHYQGRIRGHANSKVALSACNGIVSDFLIYFTRNIILFKRLEKGSLNLIYVHFILIVNLLLLL